MNDVTAILPTDSTAVRAAKLRVIRQAAIARAVAAAVTVRRMK